MPQPARRAGTPASSKYFAHFITKWHNDIMAKPTRPRSYLEVIRTRNQTIIWSGLIFAVKILRYTLLFIV